MKTGILAVMMREYVRARPAPALWSYVAWYSGYREAGVAPARHRGLPSPYLTLIFTLDDPLVIAQHVDRRRPSGSYDAMVGGLHTSPALITHDGRQSGIQVALDPLGARELLGVPAGELAEMDLDAAELLGPVAGHIREQLVTAPTWSKRFDVLDRMLLARLGESPRPPAGVRHAWRTLLRSGGTTSVAALADEVGWSARHLSGRFAAELGLSPKKAARVIRFDQARRMLARCPGSIATVAAAHGYCDQSHLVREFHALAGCSPSVWLAEELRNVQAGVWGDLPGSVS